MQYCLKHSTTGQNPAYSAVFAGKFKFYFDNKPNQRHWGHWMQRDLQVIGFKQLGSSLILVLNFDLHRFYKYTTAPDISQSKFYEVCASWDNFDRIYTDGLKWVIE